jgi:hypothetical protein
MSRLRTSMILLGICVAAMLIGGLRLLTDRTTLPTASSYSAQPDGARGLYEWAAALGGNPSRLQDAVLGQVAPTTTLLVLQPELPIDDTVRRAFDALPNQGGTLVVAGDSLPWVLYARSLGITVEPIRDAASTAHTPDTALLVSATFRYRIRANGATPLLVLPSGDWVGLRMPRGAGSLVVLASPGPLTNAGLAADQTARFVHRVLLPSAASNAAFVFDEAHHSFAPVTTDGPVTLDRLLLSTAPGRAVIYAAGLIFVFLLLSGRRLGPALPARSPLETRRTMYEHVQMLANLYRRAGQLPVVRAAFARQVARELARGAGGSPRRAAALAESLARIEQARTETELITAVAAAQPQP